MARAVLGIADVESYRLGAVIYGHYDNCQLRIDCYRDDKDSGRLFQLVLRQGNKYGQSFLGQVDGVHRQKRCRFSSRNRRNRNDFHARTGRSDDSFGINNDGRSGQTPAGSETYPPPDGFVGGQRTARQI